MGQFHPIHEIPKRDFLDGALVGAGSLRSTLVLGKTGGGGGGGFLQKRKGTYN
jgi:hypothetical protein